MTERCSGRYPVPMKRDEPFGVTYRCGLHQGHLGECSSGDQVGDRGTPAPPEDEQTDQARSGVRVPITEKQQLIDRLAEIRDAFIASGDEADAMDAGVIDYAMGKLGQAWVTRVTSEDEDSPSVVGYRASVPVSEASGSAQSASAIQHLQSAPPEDEQTDQARSGQPQLGSCDADPRGDHRDR